MLDSHYLNTGPSSQILKVVISDNENSFLPPPHGKCKKLLCKVNRMFGCHSVKLITKESNGSITSALLGF